MLLVILLQAESVPEWVLFLGRFHPLIVHLPIGILIIAALIEFFARSPRLKALQEANQFVLFWGALTATFACLFGYMLSQSGGYEEDALDTHAWLGYLVAGTAWISYFLKRSQTRILHKAYKPVFITSVLLIFGAGHYGGNLTHGSDYLTQYMPASLRTVAGLLPKKEKATPKKITDINRALVYADLVQPTLEQTCVNCHNAEKQKGELRMDTPELLLKGGENGPALVAGNAEISEMLKRIHLPVEDDDHMPPKGKPQPTAQQIALLTWWINQGAPFDRKVSELTINEEIKPVLTSFAQGNSSESEQKPENELLSLKVSKANDKVLTDLRARNVMVMPIAQNNNLLEVSFVNAKTFGDNNVALLSPVAEQTVWLKLGNTQVGDKTLAALSTFKNLIRLHLEYTNVTDAGLKNLKNVQQLTYLNLIGTAITDQGLRELGSLKNLKSLYLWQTKVTPTAVADLQKALPNTEINTGMDEAKTASTKLVSQSK